MATFGELRTRLRNDVLVESDTSFFSDADLLGFLVEASVEIAGLGGFPSSSSASVVASGASSFPAPSDISNVEFREVTFDGLQLQPSDSRTVRLYQNIGGTTRYYRFDPRSGGDVDIAPSAHASGTITVDYVKNLADESYTESDEPWDGLLPDWHDAIVYWAGVKAFERSMELDKSEYWRARTDRRLQPLAIYLQNENLLDLTTRGGVSVAGGEE